MLKTSGLLLASKSCYAIYSFVLNNNSMEKAINIQQPRFFPKKPSLNNKKSHQH